MLLETLEAAAAEFKLQQSTSQVRDEELEKLRVEVAIARSTAAAAAAAAVAPAAASTSQLAPLPPRPEEPAAATTTVSLRDMTTAQLVTLLRERGVHDRVLAAIEGERYAGVDFVIPEFVEDAFDDETREKYGVKTLHLKGLISRRKDLLDHQ